MEFVILGVVLAFIVVVAVNLRRAHWTTREPEETMRQQEEQQSQTHARETDDDVPPHYRNPMAPGVMSGQQRDSIADAIAPSFRTQ